MDDQNHDHDVCLGLGLGPASMSKSDINPRKIINDKRVLFLESSTTTRSSKDEEDTNSSIDGCSRKKLRLTRDQTTLLEDSFRRHTTLNTAQKQSLAEKLDLKPRQVEVWFQNRRARTKLKQIEVECEYLRKNCDRLTEENRKLKRELSELRSSSLRVESPPAAGGVCAMAREKWGK
ncbi:homeobox-leucine zipper protein HOX17-like [Andrographis paniculata]|uniref:homeobox-leucine zipper protein HOX17-like n=1 Tax=Andrographis paniculata TaxID=175694 RepID=UPI0021E84522|nr:homeobox-leucine zipper protein HOX17-like [Andrographis paniculata]